MKAETKFGPTMMQFGVRLLILTLAATAGVASAESKGKGPPQGSPNDGSNLPPVMSGEPPSTAIVGQPYDFLPLAYDPEGDSLSFFIKSRPGWASFDRASGRLNGTPAASDVGSVYDVTIAVADRWSKVEYGPFVITVVETTSGTTAGDVGDGRHGVRLHAECERCGR